MLDVGCVGGFQTDIPPITAPAWLHGHLVASFPDVWGIDLSPERIAYLQSHGYTNVRVANAESFALEMKFDTVIAGELIEHLPNPGLFLDRCREHLQPSGRIVITTPYPFGYEVISYAWMKYPRTCANPEHTVWICPRTMVHLADLCGLSIERHEVIRDDRRSAGWNPYSLALKASALARRLPIRISGRTDLYVLRLQKPHQPSTPAIR